MLGVKVTLKVHEAPAATVDPHGVLPEGTAAKSPLAASSEIVNVVLELFVSVTVFGALVVPIACEENDKLVGANVTGSLPVPDKAAICGLPGPEVAIASEPFTDPVSVGVNVTESVQLAPLLSAPPQGELPLPAAVKLALALTLLIVIAPVPLFVTVTDLAVLTEPTPVEVKVNEVGLSFKGTFGPPVAAPLRPTVIGLNSVLLLMASAPLIVALYCGVKVTMMVQLAPPARELPQVPPVTEKSALALELNVIEPLWPFVTVAVAVEVEPTAVLGNVRLAGLTVRGASPVPVSLTSCGLVLALSLTVRAPVKAPRLVGVNSTLIVQLPPAASELPQLLVWLNSPLAEMEPMESGPAPELESFTGFEELAAPAACLPKARVFAFRVAVPPVAIRT